MVNVVSINPYRYGSIQKGTELDFELGRVCKAVRKRAIFHLETERDGGIPDVEAHKLFLQVSFQSKATLQSISFDYQIVWLVLKKTVQ